MDIFSFLTTLFTNHQDLAYVILFLGAYFETIIGPSFFIYGEIFFLVGAILAGVGVLNIWLVSLFCIVGGILGDSTSYFIGRKYGPSILNLKLFNKFKLSSTKLDSFFKTYGAKTVFFARFMGPLSWVTPFTSGTLGIKYKDFIKYNIPGVICGIGVFLIAGYFFGVSYAIFFAKYKRIEFLILFLIAFVLLIYLINKMENSKKVLRKIVSIRKK